MQNQPPPSSPSAVAVTGSRAMLIDLAIWPSMAFVYLFVALQLGGADDFVARFFYDPVRRAFPLRHDFWTQQVLHDAGRKVMIGVALVVLAMWLLSLRLKSLQDWRRLFGYMVLSIVTSLVAVNLGKQLTNTDCPWDLTEYGGQRRHFELFQDKPNDLATGRCFPGGHSSGGFALFALFFVGRRRHYHRAWLTLAPAILVGGVFALDQWVRGAHFPSHDLTTAYLCWMVALGTYVWWFRHEEGISL